MDARRDKSGGAARWSGVEHCRELDTTADGEDLLPIQVSGCERIRRRNLNHTDAQHRLLLDLRQQRHVRSLRQPLPPAAAPIRLLPRDLRTVLTFGVVLDAVRVALGVVWCREMFGRWPSDLAEFA